MPQRLTSVRQINYAPETTEGTDPGTEGNYSALKISNLVISPDHAFYMRPVLGVGTMSGKIGAQLNPWLMFTCTLRGGGSVGVAPEVHELLKVVLSPPIDNRTYSATLTSVSGTTVTVGSTTGLTAGTAVALDTQTPANGNYEVGWVSSILNGTQFTVSHAFVNQTWNSGASVIGAYTYKPQDTGHGSLSFRIYLDSSGSNNYIAFSGCKGTVKIDMPGPGATARATFLFQAMSYTFGSSTVPTPNFTSVTPPTPHQFKMGAAATSIKLASCSLGQAIARKRSQDSTSGTFAEVVAARRCMGAIHAYDVDNTQLTSWAAEQSVALAHQFGTTQHNVVAYQVPYAQRANVSYGDDADKTTDRVAFLGAVANGSDDFRISFL